MGDDVQKDRPVRASQSFPFYILLQYGVRIGFHRLQGPPSLSFP